MGEIKWALAQQAVRFALARGWDPDAVKRGSLTLAYRNYRFRPKEDVAAAASKEPSRRKRRTR